MVTLKSKYIRRLSYIILISAIAYCSFVAFSYRPQDDGYIPKEGFVPDSTTAVKVAEAIWLPIFGNKIYNYKPFVAKLAEDKRVWIVKGTFKSEPMHMEGDTLVVGQLGGVPYVEINKLDCRILKLSHGE